MKKKSKIFGINIRDIVYGLIIAVIGAILTALQDALSSVDGFILDWPTTKKMLLVGINSGLAYIIKNFVSNSKGEFAKKEKTVTSFVEEEGPGGSSNPPGGGRPLKP